MKELWKYLEIYFRYARRSRTIPLLVFGGVFLLVILLMHYLGCMKQKKMTWKFCLLEVLLSLELSTIVVVTLYGRAKVESAVWSVKPFASYIIAFTKNDMRLLAQIIFNIVVFIPFGILLPCCFDIFEKCRYVFLISFLISVSIELIQGVAKIGLFETDDVISNLIGTGIGVLWYFLFQSWKRKRE